MDYEAIFANTNLTRRQRVDAAMHTLDGILRGIAIDGIIAPKEVAELKHWADDHRALIGKHPFAELIPKMEAALADGVIDAEEQADILWLCQKHQSENPYYNEITADIQRLHGVLHGVLSDGEISDTEIHQLHAWVDQMSHLKGYYPYDEIDALLTQVLKDGHIDAAERAMLKLFFEDFISYSLAKRVRDARGGAVRPRRLSGICTICPDLVFADRTYCFTGASTRATRAAMLRRVQDLGGSVSTSVTAKVHFLIIGAEGSPVWAYSCYGRKVEQAMNLRSEGHSLALVHEHDFWDALQDA